jgi:ABC-type transporter Mla MlaB component
MLRISETRGDQDGSVTLILEGRALGPWVAELERVAREGLGAHRGLTLDLRQVTFLDSSAVALLHDLEAHGCAVVGCSPFVDAQLRARSPS